MAVNSQSEKSHVQILHYTSDDKHSIVLSHISCIAILNVKLYDFCERPAGKRTNGRMSFRRLKQSFKYMVFVNDLATLPHPICFIYPPSKYARNVTLFYIYVSFFVCVTYDVDIDYLLAWTHSFTKWNSIGLKLIGKRCTFIISLLFFIPL